MNIKLCRQVMKWCIHLIFCAIFLYVFRSYCSLRPAAFPSLYKEFIAGLVVLAAVYLNYFLLFPHLFARRKYLSFWLLTFCSILLAGGLEMLIVFSQVKEIYKQTCEISLIRHYMVLDTIAVCMRNGGWVLFAIIISEISRIRKQEQDKEISLRQQYHFIDVRCSDYSNAFINTKDIYYCMQEHNTVTIYTNNLNQYFRYCSMVRMEDLLGTEEFIRISRNVIVSKKYIGKFSDGRLELRKPNKYSKTTFLPVGQAYESVLKEHIQLETERKNALNGNKKRKSGQKNTKSDNPLPKTILEEFEHNPKLLAVYLQIKKKPDSNVNSISFGCRIPKGTVRRYVSFLMDKQLIEHSGSRRYGGYRAIMQNPLAEV